MSQVRLTAFRYSPAIGGAENYSRRLLREIGDRLDIDVVTLLNRQRTDWLPSLIEGDRDEADSYVVDGRNVVALGRWPVSTQRALRLLIPGYHLPASPAPWLMARLLTRHLEAAVSGTQLVHNVFMGREAFSAGLLLAAKKASLPFVFTPLRHERPLGWSSPAFRRLYQQSDAVIALTNSEAAWLESHGADKSRLHVIGLGPQNDPEASPEPALEMLGRDRKIVLFLAQLHAYKGFRELLAAARLLERRGDVRFVFAGPDVRGNSAAFARAADNVTWMGVVPANIRDSLLSACDVLCVPSSRESFGSVVVEAWSCGKPVVGGPAAATRELIEDGVDGFVVPQRPEVIAERVSQLLDDSDLARDMGCRGKEKVDRQFSWKAISQAHVAIYERLLAGTAR
ncbi:MAG: glycosyltransferase family 4 protein [Candidatus Dormibacteraeota bacterium]|nr:glycosyltransferase family 4 protein [Candidatus Dormibacteraeota bacterium]